MGFAVSWRGHILMVRLIIRNVGLTILGVGCLEKRCAEPQGLL